MQELEEFLNSQVKKVYVGEGVIVNIEEMNQLIRQSSGLIQQVMEKHQQFFAI